MGKWAAAFPIYAIGDEWRPRTPAEIRHGCFVIEPALPIWTMFLRLSRGRVLLFSGQPCPLHYRDIYDAARRVRSGIDADTIEQILTDLDDLFFELIPKNADVTHSN